MQNLKPEYICEKCSRKVNAICTLKEKYVKENIRNVCAKCCSKIKPKEENDGRADGN
jgi:hypothetical protein